MAHPNNAADILPTIPAYARGLIERQGLDKAIPILERARNLWRAIGEEAIAAAYDRAIAAAKVAQNAK